MLDNALSDIKYLRQEVAALREAKASAKAEAYELKEELVEAGQALDVLADRTDELEHALKRATARADENANKLIASVTQAQVWADKYRRQQREVDDLEQQLGLYQENCECSQ